MQLRFSTVPISLVVSCLFAAASTALPIVSIDMNVESPTIDENLSIQLGTQFSIDVVISGVDETLGEFVNGFEFDVLFDRNVLRAISINAGSFLSDPSITFQQSIGDNAVEVAGVTLSSDGASGSGLLARIVFESIGEGISTLDLENVILSRPFGIQLPSGSIADGSAVVVGGGPAVPEPTAAVLYAAGLGLVALRSYFRR